MSSPPESKQPNGARLAAIMDGLRRATPIPTQGQGGSRRTSGGYTQPSRVGTAVNLPPFRWYSSGGNLHLSPGFINGLVPTVHGVALDTHPPPPILSIEDLESRRHWFVAQLTFADPRVEILGWPEYDEGFAVIGHIPFRAIVPGTPTLKVELLAITEETGLGVTHGFREDGPLNPDLYWVPIGVSGQSLADLQAGHVFEVNYYRQIELLGRKAPGASDPADWLTPYIDL